MTTDGDTMGDADELYDGEVRLTARPATVTAEARAITAAGLVLCSFLSFGLSQAITFVVFTAGGSQPSPIRQYVYFTAGPGVLAAAGAAVGLTVRGRELSPALRGLATAAVVIGSAVVLVLVVAAIAATQVHSQSSF